MTLDSEKQIIQAILFKKLKKLKKRQQEILENIAYYHQWTTVHHEGELIKFHFAFIKRGVSSITVQDWLTDQPYHLTLDPKKKPEEEMAARFKKAKKMKSGIAPLTKFLERTELEIKNLERQIKQLKTIQSEEELSTFLQVTPTLPLIKPLPSKRTADDSNPIYREFVSKQGLKIWVGKSAKANDKLSFQLAHGSDWWLHVKGYSGSHVIIRTTNDQDPDAETLADAMQLALYFSKARSQNEGEIVFTKRKYVSRLGGKNRPGLVQISKHKIAWIRFDPARYQTIINKNKKT